MKDHIFLLLITGLFISITGCNKPVAPALADELLTIDRSFSKLSEEKGMKHAFLEFAGDNVVMLRKNKMPLKGKPALEDQFKTFTDTGFVLTWEPVFAEISESGDLGYTYGIYTSASQNPDGSKKENKGTYVSIWKKDPERNWKFVLDSGNEGTGEQP